MPTALRSITWALVLMNGGRRSFADVQFILTIGTDSRPMRIVLYQWRCLRVGGAAARSVMEVIVGFWLVTTLCATTKDRSCDGTFPVPILRTESRAEDRLRSENVALREEIDKASMFEEIVGTSASFANCALAHFQSCADVILRFS